MKKKVLFMLLIITMVCSLAIGCKGKDNNKSKETTTVQTETGNDKKSDESKVEVEESENDQGNVKTGTEEWKTYDVVINGITIHLPCSYEELSKASNAEFGQDLISDSLNPDNYLDDLPFFNVITSSIKEFKVGVYNDTGIVQEDLKNCKITTIKQDKWEVDDGATPIVFPGNLSVGMKVSDEDIRSIFSEEPSYYELYTRGFSYYYSWSEVENSDENILEVDVNEDRVITRILLNHNIIY